MNIPYPLDYGPNWDKYSASEKAQICNGVGAKDQPQWLADLLAKLPYLYAASLVHDIDYHTGGTSRDRRKADLRFRRNCYIAAKHEIGNILVRYFTRKGRRKWAFAVPLIEGGYVALRMWGRPAFNYTTAQDKGVEQS